MMDIYAEFLPKFDSEIILKIDALAGYNQL